MYYFFLTTTGGYKVQGAAAPRHPAGAAHDIMSVCVCVCVANATLAGATKLNTCSTVIGEQTETMTTCRLTTTESSAVQRAHTR